MTIANTFAAKASVAFVAIAMALSMIAPAQAATAEELQAQIDALMAQIAGLQGQTAPAASSAAYTFTRALTIGSEGADVTALQTYLIGAGHAIPAGATGYFGAQTQAAVAAWQTANGVMPAAGYFGPVSQAKYAMLMASAPATDDTDDTDTDDTDDTDSADLGDGEGSIESIDEVSSDDSNINEGETGEILAFEVKIEGDVEINRVDIYLESDSAASENADDYFTGATLWVDGEEVGAVDVDDFDEDDYDIVTNDSTDEYRLRFSGLEVVGADGDEPEFVLALEVNGSVDSADLASDWTATLADDSIRFVDGEGFSDDDGDTAVTETFGFEAEETAELQISETSDNPDATTFKIEEDDEESDEYEAFIFEIEEENGVDVTIDEMRVTITTTGSTTESDVVDEAILYMGGEELASESVPNGGVVNFENLDVAIDADSTEEFSIGLVFKGEDDHGNSSDVTVAFTSILDAEDANGNDEGDMTISGSASSETHALRTVVPVVTDTSFTVDRNEDGDAGTISFEFTIGAEDDDYDFGVATKTDVNGSTDDIRFTLSGTDTAIATSSITLVSGDATSTGAGWTIADGDEATFVMDVTFTTVNAGDNGTYRVTVDTVGGIEVDETSDGMSLTN